MQVKNIADNNWHHIAVSRQGTSLKLFIDSNSGRILRQLHHKAFYSGILA